MVSGPEPAQCEWLTLAKGGGPSSSTTTGGIENSHIAASLIEDSWSKQPWRTQCAPNPLPHFPPAFQGQNKLKRTGSGHKGFHLPEGTSVRLHGAPLVSSLPCGGRRRGPYLSGWAAENSSEVMCFKKSKQKKKICEDGKKVKRVAFLKRRERTKLDGRSEYIAELCRSEGFIPQQTQRRWSPPPTHTNHFLPGKTPGAFRCTLASCWASVRTRDTHTQMLPPPAHSRLIRINEASVDNQGLKLKTHRTT